jgi:hypothetical protein
MEAIKPLDGPPVAPPWARDQHIANGRDLFPTYRLPLTLRHLLTTFLFNEIPPICG